MSTFTLDICLTTPNLPWSMNLRFQVPMQYCSLQHWTLLPSPVISTTGCCFCFGSISSFFLELFLHWSPVAYWAPTDLGSSSFTVLSFCLFIVFLGFSRQKYWSGLPLFSPVDHVLSELSTMTHPFWVALQGMAFSYCSWGSQGKNIEMVCHSLLQWTMLCQNSPSWSIHLGWLYTAWLKISLSYTRLYTVTLFI